MKTISLFVIPLICIIIISYGILKRVNIFEAFLEGAAEGTATVIKILPALVGLVAAITMFRTSGALDFIIKLLSPVTRILRVPDEVLPLALLRPVSGSGALAVVSDILSRFGADSEAGRIASVMMGSTETTFYTLCVYFGSVKITDSRYTVFAALCADIAGFLASCWVCRIFFS
ncbi:MAG: spore maturation protein [Ruminococcaceae bacterium]|nr:spore maturation protein [Oscillospiraceae bacterium]